MSDWKFVEVNETNDDGFTWYEVIAYNDILDAIMKVVASEELATPGASPLIDSINVTPGESSLFLKPDAFLLRDIPLNRIISQASYEITTRKNVAAEMIESIPNFQALATEWPKGDIDEVAKWAGYIYLNAIKSGKPANKAVQDAYGMTRSTAQRVIKRARMIGAIPDGLFAPSIH